MKIKTSELIGEKLDWAVAKALGKELVLFDDWFRANGRAKGYSETDIDLHLSFQQAYQRKWVQLDEFQTSPQRGEPETLKKAVPIDSYSMKWECAGPIIEQESITITPSGERVFAECRGVMRSGKTMLIAAMRSFVASRLGDEVDIPEELK